MPAVAAPRPLSIAHRNVIVIAQTQQGGPELHQARLAQAFGTRTPLVLAPMALASGGLLAAEWARAGALGLVGGGYGDLAWTSREYRLAAERLSADPEALGRLGCGFISWALERDCSAFDWLLDQPRPPAALMLSFGDPARWARRALDRGIPVICQIQRLEQLPQVIDCGASVVVAQGAEAGGHGMCGALGRSTMTLVPEIADALRAHAPDTLLLAAGGIGDGRGVAAALMLGADGALIGTRAWATQESLANAGAKAAALAASGDETMRTGIFDILRRKNWPAPYDFRAMRNALHRAWEGREEELRQDPSAAIADYDEGASAQDFTRAHVTVGEATGLIRDIPASADLIARLHLELTQLVG